MMTRTKAEKYVRQAIKNLSKHQGAALPINAFNDAVNLLLDNPEQKSQQDYKGQELKG